MIKYSIHLFLLLCITTVATYAQNNQSRTLNIGDSAPLLQIRQWVKGSPIQEFEKGKVYVIDFWATWCKPCIAGMPHLSALSDKYKGKVTIIEVDIRERNKDIGRIKNFVDSMGKRMNFHVALEDSNYMDVNWINSFGARGNGIPITFIVNADRKVAWIGYPLAIDSILPKILNNIWNINEASAKRNLERYLKEEDVQMGKKLNAVAGKADNSNKFGRPDSTLILIAEIVKKEPKLKYAPMVAYHTFFSLLVTNQQKAYEFGKKLIVTSSYVPPAYDDIIYSIQWLSDKINLSAEIYQLGAEAYQEQIDHYIYPEFVDGLPKEYHEMAAWYWLSDNKSKAIEAEQNAIKVMKSKEDFSSADLIAYEAKLQEYKKR